MTNDSMDSIRSFLEEAVSKPVTIVHDLATGKDSKPTPEERIARALEKLAERD